MRCSVQVLWECGGTLAAPAISGAVIHKALAFIAPKLVRCPRLGPALFCHVPVWTYIRPQYCSPCEGMSSTIIMSLFIIDIRLRRWCNASRGSRWSYQPDALRWLWPRSAACVRRRRWETWATWR